MYFPFALFSTSVAQLKIIFKGKREILAKNQMMTMKKRMQKIAVFLLFILFIIKILEEQPWRRYFVTRFRFLIF